MVRNVDYLLDGPGAEDGRYNRHVSVFRDDFIRVLDQLKELIVRHQLHDHRLEGRTEHLGKHLDGD